MRTLAAASAALVLLASACSDLPTGTGTPSAPAPRPGGLHAELRCTVSVARGMSCGGEGQAYGDLPDLVVGGQNVYVRLEATPGVYDAADSTYTIGVTVENLMAQVLGTPDGLTGTGVHYLALERAEVRPPELPRVRPPLHPVLTTTCSASAASHTTPPSARWLLSGSESSIAAGRRTLLTMKPATCSRCGHGTHPW